MKLPRELKDRCKEVERTQNTAWLTKEVSRTDALQHLLSDALPRVDEVEKRHLDIIAIVFDDAGTRALLGQSSQQDFDYGQPKRIAGIASARPVDIGSRTHIL